MKCLSLGHNDALPSSGTERRANLCSYPLSCNAVVWDDSVKCLSPGHNTTLCPHRTSNLAITILPELCRLFKEKMMSFFKENINEFLSLDGHIFQPVLMSVIGTPESKLKHHDTLVIIIIV